MKVKPNKGQTFKPFEIELRESTLSWKKRCELNDVMISESSKQSNPSFSFWGDFCLKYAKLTEDDMMNYEIDEIIAMANAIFDEANRKKK